MRGKSRELVMAEYSCDSRIQEGGVLHETMELILFMCIGILLTSMSATGSRGCWDSLGLELTWSSERVASSSPFHFSGGVLKLTTMIVPSKWYCRHQLQCLIRSLMIFWGLVEFWGL